MVKYVSAIELCLVLLFSSIRYIIVLVTLDMTISVSIGMAVSVSVSMNLAIGSDSVGVSVHGYLGWLWHQVGMVEEVEEENEVREVHEKGPLDIRVSDVTLVATRFLEVGDRIDDNADNHLRDLTAGDDDIDPFWNSVAERAKSVVRVHGSMHGEVHEDEPTTRGAEVFARVPAVDEDSCVVIPVEENELLLA